MNNISEQYDSEQNRFSQMDWVAQAAQMERLETAKNQALKYVSARMRTMADVADFLQKKGYEADIVDSVITFLLQYQYLDDAAYCRAWIHDKIQFHPCGRKKMAMELARKVSDRQLVQFSLEEYFSEEQELELALAAARQKLDGRSGKKQVSREQLARFLYGRGYGGSIIEQVLHTLTVR